MNKHKDVLRGESLSIDTVSKKLQGLILDHERTVTEYNSEKEKISEMESDDPQYDEMKQELQELEETLLSNDEELCAMILKYVKAKAGAEKMQEGRKKWAASKNADKKTENTSVTKTDVPLQGNVEPPQIQTPAPVIVTAAQGAVIPKAEEPKDDILTWFLWGALAVAGFFVGSRIIKKQ